jgi:hypothetical protein
MIINLIIASYTAHNCNFDLRIVSEIKDEKRNFSRFEREFTKGKLSGFNNRQILSVANRNLAKSIVRRKLENAN